MLYSFVTILMSTWHTVRNQQPMYTVEFEVIGHSGKDMVSTKAVTVGPKWSPHHSSQNKGSHQHLYRECLLDRSDTIQSMRESLASHWIHVNLLLVSMKDTPLASKWYIPSHQQKWGKQMLQRIAEETSLPEMSYDEYDADDLRDHLLDLGGAEGISRMSLTWNKFSVKYIA